MTPVMQVVFLISFTGVLDVNTNSPEEGTDKQHEIYHKIDSIF